MFNAWDQISSHEFYIVIRIGGGAIEAFWLIDPMSATREILAGQGTWPRFRHGWGTGGLVGVRVGVGRGLPCSSHGHSDFPKVKSYSQPVYLTSPLPSYHSTSHEYLIKGSYRVTS